MFSFLQGILDIFREGFARILTGGGPRALPMWYLIPATVSFGLAHYVLSASVTIVRFSQKACYGALSLKL